MPANKKYLTRSPLHRWLKITAGFFGGYAVTVSFFLMLTYFFDREDVLMLHWNKIVSNFSLFRPWSRLKAVWTAG